MIATTASQQINSHSDIESSKTSMQHTQGVCDGDAPMLMESKQHVLPSSSMKTPGKVTFNESMATNASLNLSKLTDLDFEHKEKKAIERQAIEQANLILTLRKALREVIGKNERLESKVTQLEARLKIRDEEIEAKDKAIEELYMVLDLHMNGALTEKAINEEMSNEESSYEDASHQGEASA